MPRLEPSYLKQVLMCTTDLMRASTVSSLDSLNIYSSTYSSCCCACRCTGIPLQHIVAMDLRWNNQTVSAVVAQLLSSGKKHALPPTGRLLILDDFPDTGCAPCLDKTTVVIPAGIPTPKARGAPARIDGVFNTAGCKRWWLEVGEAMPCWTRCLQMCLHVTTLARRRCSACPCHIVDGKRLIGRQPSVKSAPSAVGR